MKKRFIFITLIIILISNIIFAAPTSAPFNMNDKKSTSYTANKTQTTNSPGLFNINKESPKQTEEKPSTPQITNTTNSSSNTLILITTINSILILILILIQIIPKLKIPHKTKTSKNLNDYENTKDSVYYNDTFNKLEGYMVQHIPNYGYESVKTALLQQGFVNQDIEAIYLELKKQGKC